MSIQDKIGTHRIELIGGEPNYDMIDRITAKRAPLTPDLFPYYAGSLDDGYGFYDENGYWIEEGIPTYEAEELAEDDLSDYDEIYRDELEAFNHPAIEDIERISKLVDETEGTIKKEEDLQNKLNDLDKEHNDVHVSTFNDVAKEEPKKDVAPSLSITEPAKEEVKTAPVPPVPPVPPMPPVPPVSVAPVVEPEKAPVPPVPPVSITPKEVEENSNSYAAKFTTEAKPKSEPYTDVLEDLDDSFKKETN